MQTRIGHWAPPLLLALLVVTGGCAADRVRDRGSAPPAGGGFDAVELWKTPFYPQTQYQCGPAALATALTAAGTAVTPEALTPEVYIPGRRGSLQLELVTATRRRGLIAYRIEPDFTNLVAELGAGRPVLVLQNLGFRRYPLWHYAVLIGFEPKANRILLRSGTYERLSMSERKFRSTWEAGGRWGLVVLRPGDLPINPDAGRYLGEVAALEALGHWDEARRGYAAALRRWPDNELALLGLGNVHYLRGDLARAGSIYRELTQLSPGHSIALNNLAQVLVDQGCPGPARAAIDRALGDEPASGRFRATLERTRSEIDEHGDAPVGGCSAQP